MTERKEAGVIHEAAAPCGLYCGVCRLYTATQEGDLGLLGRLARIYARRLEDVNSLTADDLLYAAPARSGIARTIRGSRAATAATIFPVIGSTRSRFRWEGG